MFILNQIHSIFNFHKLKFLLESLKYWQVPSTNLFLEIFTLFLILESLVIISFVQNNYAPINLTKPWNFLQLDLLLNLFRQIYKVESEFIEINLMNASSQFVMQCAMIVWWMCRQCFLYTFRIICFPFRYQNSGSFAMDFNFHLVSHLFEVSRNPEP